MGITIALLMIGSFLLGGLAFYAAGKHKGYWNGRLAGWKACEHMILNRATEHKDYDRDKVWKDLIQ